MNQRETQQLSADDSSIVICIFPNLQNANILVENADISHFTPDEAAHGLAPRLSGNH